MLLLRRLFGSTRPVRFTRPSTPRAFFTTTTTTLSQKPLPPRPTILETDITEAFLKGTGPGGQKINKTSSAVQLKHLPTGLVIKCQETRSRTQNRKIARRILAERVELLLVGHQSRAALKAEREKKKKASKNKKARRKYRKLDHGSEVEIEDAETNHDQHHADADHETCDIEEANTDSLRTPAPDAAESHQKP